MEQRQKIMESENSYGVCVGDIHMKMDTLKFIKKSIS